MSDPFDLAHHEPAAAVAPVLAVDTPAAPPPYLVGLNDAQSAAVLATEGPVLVLAGAGTGKTKVLTTRLTHILNARRAFPSQILAVTFTNKAAREMVERVRALIGEAVEGLWIGTFHSIGARILRRHAELVGLKPNFTILDTDDQLRLYKQILQAANIDEKRWPARSLASVIDRWKDRGYTPDKVPTADAGDFGGGRSIDLYKLYQQRLIALNATDFGDLLLHTISIFLTNAEVLVDYHRRFKYVLVDEYQDTNVAQYLWLRLLARGHNNICCVGDDDQSIYGWRGAEVGNILRFEQDFPGAQVIRLERNYRSTTHILACASALIAHNQSRLGKILWTESEHGEKVSVKGVWDDAAEALFVAEEIEALQRRGNRLTEMAILVRASFQTRAFEERFLTTGVPYRVIGGLKFYERREVRDALAYLRVLMVPQDDLAFGRIINVPKRGIGESTIRALHQLSRAEQIPLTEAAKRLIETDELRPNVRQTIRRLLELFDRWRSLISSSSAAEVVETVLDDSGYTQMWQADRSPDAPGRLENLKEFVRAIGEFESLSGFLEHIALVTDNDEAATADRVNLMTLHAAKGLEFDTVFLPGWEEGLFPHRLALDQGGTKGLEEERRLAHVGLTRARHRAIISFAASRRTFGEVSHGNIPSRFVDELPAEHIEQSTDSGLYTRGGVADWSLGWGNELEDRVDNDGNSYGQYRARYKRGRPQLGERTSRYRGASGSPGPVVEAEAEPAPPPAPSAYSRGQRVFHQKFGYGKILMADGEKLEIQFDKSDVKKVMASFIRPA
ncbi:MAG: hypothetical protein EXQ91_01630 [Alphaproteobacteria bacterium]|nr:hypothetical protein [Alphaproteobacteria bacterium]